jgi:hypothetical protein
MLSEVTERPAFSCSQSPKPTFLAQKSGASINPLDELAGRGDL